METTSKLLEIFELEAGLTNANDENVRRENSPTLEHHLRHLFVLASDLHHTVIHVEFHILLSQHLQEQQGQKAAAQCHWLCFHV